MHKTKNLYSLLSLFLLILLAFFFLFPLYWIITGSFKTAQSINGTSPDWFPKEWVLLNYQKLFSRQPTALFTLSIPFSGAFSGTGKDIVLMTGPKVPGAVRWLLNTVFMSLSAMILTCVTASMAGYALAKKRFRGRTLLFTLIVCAMALPKQVILIPLIREMSFLKLYNSLLAVIFPTVGWPFGVFLMKQFSEGVPGEMLEASRIDGASEARIFSQIVLPMVKPVILSTILLVFGSAMGSYPVPHYLGLTTLSTKYVSMNSKYTGEASVLAIIMMLFGVAIMLMNQISLTSRKNYTTVTGKSGQISKIQLGKLGRYIIAFILVILTFFTSIFPILSFAVETFLPNPGDYSFLYTGDLSNLTTKWWITAENITENGMYGQMGILYNNTIRTAFFGTLLVSFACAILAGTIGTLIGYAVSKNRRSKWANYVNAVAFLPYLMPSIAVGVAYFILFSNKYINLFNTYWLLIIVGTIKYIPFASKAALNSMLQLSGEIEESAIILNIPWIQRMTRIIIPIQKSSIISGYLLPFMTCLRELSLFMLLCVQGFILSTTLDYFDEMGLYAFSSGINLILIVTILICNSIVNKVTGASLDKGIGG